MKRFKFRFAAVEKVRKAREDEALRRLAEARRTHATAVYELEAVVAERNRALDRRDVLSARGETLSIVDVGLESHFISTVRYRIHRHQMAVARAARGIEKALRILLLARRDLMVMDRIREKDVAAFRAERKKWEMKQMDEVASLRFGARKESILDEESGGAA